MKEGGEKELRNGENKGSEVGSSVATVGPMGAQALPNLQSRPRL